MKGSPTLTQQLNILANVYMMFCVIDKMTSFYCYREISPELFNTKRAEKLIIVFSLLVNSVQVWRLCLKDIHSNDTSKCLGDNDEIHVLMLATIS